MSVGRELLTSRVGARNMTIRVAGTLAGLAAAYVGSWVLLAEFDGGGVTDVGRMVQSLGIFLVLATVSLTLTSLLPIRVELLEIHRLVEHHEHTLTERSRGLQFLRHVQSAFDMAEQEDELYEIAGLALRDASDHPGEILVADSSNAHIDQHRSCTAFGNGSPRRSPTHSSPRSRSASGWSIRRPAPI